ncbi:MAG: hypothetical protein R3A79_24110 [Nannocystaceae bacterium]
MRRPSRRQPRPLAALALGLGLVLSAGSARADTLVVDPNINTERSYVPFDELSYEVIVEGMEGFRADVRVRTALHNNSAREQDVVLSLALPQGAEIHGLKVARGGEWRDGDATAIAEPGRRDPGTVFVRDLPAEDRDDLPGAEIVGFSLDPGSTTQIEVKLLVPPRMSGDRWEITLPERGNSPLGLARERRVIVKDAKEFWIDGRASEGKPVLTSRADDRVVLSWPASLPSLRSKGPTLDARYEVTRAAEGGGDFRLYLRLGATAALRPDHVVVVVDRSKSTSSSLHREAFTMIAALFDALPATTTFDAVAFARDAQPLLGDGPAPDVRDADARQRLAVALDRGARQQGSNLAAAFAAIGPRLRDRGAKRPLILVVTDGMLPLTITPDRVDAALADGLGVRPHARGWPEILFAVDEPMLARQGLDPEHPVAQMAAGLGARISLETLAHKADEVADLMAAPQVLRDLEIALPKSAVLDQAAPAGLVAGNFAVLSGTFEGRPPQPRIRGKIGNKTIRVAPRTRSAAAPPAALVASVGLAPLADAVAEGFAPPPWHTRKQQRDARLGITWAGRGGQVAKGFLDWRIFRRYLGTRVYPRARACYNRALTRDQTLRGRVVYTFEVGKGEVMHAELAELELSREDPELRECLLEAAWHLIIPAGQMDDQLYRLRYPLVLNPPEGGKAAPSVDPLGEGTVELLLRSTP